MRSAPPALLILASQIAFAPLGCGSDGVCANNVDWSCEESGLCFCGSGPNEGDECISSDETTADDPDNCETTCASCDESGPESVLMGN
jgi:hypothetical protein